MPEQLAPTPLEARSRELLGPGTTWGQAAISGLGSCSSASFGSCFPAPLPKAAFSFCNQTKAEAGAGPAPTTAPRALQSKNARCAPLRSARQALSGNADGTEETWVGGGAGKGQGHTLRRAGESPPPISFAIDSWPPRASVSLGLGRFGWIPTGPRHLASDPSCTLCRQPCSWVGAAIGWFWGLPMPLSSSTGLILW